jgi:signal peptidase I
LSIARSTAFTEVAAELLGRGRSVRFRAEGGSMHPAIRAGDKLVVQPVALDELGIGDVALYRNGRGVTAHRVVAVPGHAGQGSLFLMRGDAGGMRDEPVEPERILGKVVAVESGGPGTALWRACAGLIRACFPFRTRSARLL